MSGSLRPTCDRVNHFADDRTRLNVEKEKAKPKWLRPFIFNGTENQTLLASVHILDAVTLVFELTRDVECLPATILALILIRRWPYLRRRSTGTKRGAERGVVNDAVRIDNQHASPTRVGSDGWPRRA